MDWIKLISSDKKNHYNLLIEGVEVGGGLDKYAIKHLVKEIDNELQKNG